MENIAERIKELIDDQQLSNTEFAKKTNLNPAIISHILGGRNKPSLQVIQAIKDSFTNVNLDYLISGEGPLYRDFTNVKQPDLPAPSDAADQSLFPMEGLRVASLGSPKPLSGTEEKVVEPAPQQQPEFETASKPSPALPREEAPTDQRERSVEQIVIFYNDGSFKAYRP